MENTELLKEDLLAIDFMNFQIKMPFFHKTCCDHYFDISFWEKYIEEQYEKNKEILVYCPQCGIKTM